MTEANRRANLLDELTGSARSLRAAELLLQAGLWQDCVSRAYYAAFYAVTALLLSAGLQARSHSGTRHLLWEHFVQPGRLPAELHRLASDLQDRRETADYAHPQLAEEDARRAVADARQVRDIILATLRRDGWLET